MNISTKSEIKELSHLFFLLSRPERLQILISIGKREVCVCHLEALLGERQAYISQELMLLKESGLVECRRSGRNMYYRLSDPDMLNQLSLFAREVGVELSEPDERAVPGCPCPQCNPGLKECLPE